MDIDKAKWALENIFARIERDPIGGNWKLNGSVTAGEREAFLYVLNHMGVQPTPADAVGAAASIADAYPLNLTSTTLGEPQEQEIMLCLDFGTAMSKAFALASDEAPIDLAVGQRSGYTESVYALPSSLFISASGRIFLGHEAIAESLNDQTLGRQRFDSPKQELSQGTTADLSTALLGNDINPSGVPFTKADLITLYLAYLTDMACTELQERHSRSRYVRRRFARPCWDEKRTVWAEQLLVGMLSKAQVLADTFNGKWKGGLNAAAVRSAFDEIKKVTLPSFLIVGSVEEPVAAAASIVLQGERQHPGFLVVDVGAGTTDFGLFVVVQPRGREPTLYRLPGSIHGIRQAGDTVDTLLRAFILRKHAIDLHTQYGLRISAELNLHIRSYKETLFQTETLSYRLGDDAAGTVSLRDFLESPDIRRFSEGLRYAVTRTFEGVAKSWITRMFYQPGVLVVLTGGGARLPMVRELTTGWIESHGMRVLCHPAATVPAWIAAKHPEFTQEYPQLAVAMGGAASLLPEMGPDTPEFPGLTTPTYVAGNLHVKGV